MELFDFLIIGSGLFGSVCARELTDNGYKCLIVEKRNHFGGNIYTENIENINVHKYGPHIFHTDDINIWNYVNRFVAFNSFTYRPKVSYKGKIFSFPINLMTLYQLWGVKTPEEAEKKLASVRILKSNPKNLEEWILSQVGKEIYEIFIYGYTKKQWMRDPTQLPASIIQRLPIRLNFDDNYYLNHLYQGIPIGGYTKLIEKLIENIDIHLNTDFLENRQKYEAMAKKIIYTGPIDAFFDYAFGELEYRTLKFENEILNISDYQGIAGMNYTEELVPYTRIIEHKHFEYGQQPKTVITKEYPIEWTKDSIPYYPINDEKNMKIFEQYKKKSGELSNYYFGGRLAEYKYHDMHQIIRSALNLIKKILQP